ncbi:MAG: hypothetical protein PHT79_04985 [Syntrophomonadaceae bacterium]|nr:hypothetical protein [Syntrophomonadaceae bacterium]
MKKLSILKDHLALVGVYPSGTTDVRSCSLIWTYPSGTTDVRMAVRRNTMLVPAVIL